MAPQSTIPYLSAQWPHNPPYHIYQPNGPTIYHTIYTSPMAPQSTIPYIPAQWPHNLPYHIYQPNGPTIYHTLYTSIPGAIHYEDVFPDGERAVIPHQQELEGSVRHPGNPHGYKCRVGHSQQQPVSPATISHNSHITNFKAESQHPHKCITVYGFYKDMKEMSILRKYAM